MKRMLGTLALRDALVSEARCSSRAKTLRLVGLRPTLCHVERGMMITLVANELEYVMCLLINIKQLKKSVNCYTYSVLM